MARYQLKFADVRWIQSLDTKPVNDEIPDSGAHLEVSQRPMMKSKLKANG